MRAQGVQSSNKSNFVLVGVVGFEQSSQHFSSKNYRTNQKKKKIHLSPCAVATNDLSNSNNKDGTMNFSGLPFFFFNYILFTIVS